MPSSAAVKRQRQSIIALKHDLLLLCIISVEKYDSHFNAIGLKHLPDDTPFPRFNERNVQAHIHAQFSSCQAAEHYCIEAGIVFFVSFELKSMILISMQLGLYTH